MGQAKSFNELISGIVMRRYEVDAYMASLVWDDAPKKRTPERANSRPRMLRLVSGDGCHAAPDWG